MKNRSIRTLRQIIGRTQEQFAAMIGVTKDAVINWENGRNAIKQGSAQSIRVATGADIGCLMRGDGNVIDQENNPYTNEYFEMWRKHYSRSDEAQAQKWFESVQDSFWLVYMAAAKKGVAKKQDRLPALHAAVTDFLRQVYKDFGLEPEIKALLKKRKSKDSKTHPYGVWRDPNFKGFAEFYGFKDNKKKKDEELLTLEVEVHPIWNAGSNMKGPSFTVTQPSKQPAQS